MLGGAGQQTGLTEGFREGRSGPVPLPTDRPGVCQLGSTVWLPLSRAEWLILGRDVGSGRQRFLDLNLQWASITSSQRGLEQVTSEIVTSLSLFPHPGPSFSRSFCT